MSERETDPMRRIACAEPEDAVAETEEDEEGVAQRGGRGRWSGLEEEVEQEAVAVEAVAVETVEAEREREEEPKLRLWSLSAARSATLEGRLHGSSRAPRGLRRPASSD
jgi:hypothetical protein